MADHTPQDLLNQALFYLNEQDLYGIDKDLRLKLVGMAAREVQSEIDQRTDITLNFQEVVITYDADARYVDLTSKLSTEIAANGNIKDILRVSLLEYNRLPDNDNVPQELPWWDDVRRNRRLNPGDRPTIMTQQVTASVAYGQQASYAMKIRDNNLYLDPVPSESIYLLIEWRYWMKDPATLTQSAYWSDAMWFGEFYGLVSTRIARKVAVKSGQDTTPIDREYADAIQRLGAAKKRQKYTGATYFDFQKRF